MRWRAHREVSTYALPNAHGVIAVWHVPLWVPASVFFVLSSLSWRARIASVRHERIGRCHACGDLRVGLQAGAPCPECGGVPKGASA
jgi:hypothetical protein